MQVLELIAYSQSKTAACKEAGIDPVTFWRRVKSDVEFAGFYERARQVGRREQRPVGRGTRASTSR